MDQIRSNIRMKIGYIIFLTITFTFDCDLFAQTGDSLIEVKLVDELPKFRGDANSFAFQEYIIRELNKSTVKAPDSVTGRIIVSYVVDSTGYITDVKLIDSIGYPLDYELVRIIQDSPVWTPGKVDRKPVRTLMTLPVRVSPDDESTNNESLRSQESTERNRRRNRKK